MSLICFSLKTNDILLISHLFIFLGEIPIKIFCPIFNSIHLSPHVPSIVRLQAPRDKRSVSFVIRTLLSNAVPDIELMFKKGLLNEWISKGHPLWRLICHCSRIVFIILMFPFIWYIVTWFSKSNIFVLFSKEFILSFCVYMCKTIWELSFRNVNRASVLF